MTVTSSVGELGQCLYHPGQSRARSDDGSTEPMGGSMRRKTTVELPERRERDSVSEKEISQLTGSRQGTEEKRRAYHVNLSREYMARIIVIARKLPKLAKAAKARDGLTSKRCSK